jgi:hypothetical protein
VRLMVASGSLEFGDIIALGSIELC